MQDRLIFIVFILLLLFKRTSQSKYFQPYKQINQAHPNDDISFVKICSKQTFMVTASYYQIKIWKYSTLVNLITSTYSSNIIYVQLHPIDCRIFISLYNSTILVLDGNNFSQLHTFNYPSYFATSIVFILQKHVFYLVGQYRNKIDKYNANTYSLMTSMDIPSWIYLMDGYYNHQLRTAILIVSLNNAQFKIYNMETNTQINLPINFNINPFYSPVKFSKSGKFLFTWNYANKCLNVFNLNQNKNIFQQFSKVCNLNYYFFHPQQLISTAYSDDFAIIIDQYNTLKMVQLILKKQFKVIDDYQLFNNDYIYSMSQVNKIIALGTINGNVILVKVKYPFTSFTSFTSSKQQICIIGGIIFLVIVLILIFVRIYCLCKFKSNDTQKKQQHNIKKSITIEQNTIKIKKEKKKNKHLIQTKDTLNDSKLNLIQEEQESSNKIMLREKQQLKENEHQIELKIQEEQIVENNDQQLKEQNKKSLYQQIQEQKRQNIQLSKKAKKISNRIKLQPITHKKTSFKQENKEEEILSDHQQQGHQKQLQKQEVKEQKSKKQDSNEFE